MRRWITRAALLGGRVASVAFPGFWSAVHRRTTAALVFGLGSAAIVVMGAIASALVGCTCPAIAAAVVYALTGLASSFLPLDLGRSRRPILFGLLGAVALPLIALTAVRATVLDLYHVPTSSMAPTLLPGDYILVSRLGREPERGDLVVFRGHDGLLYVKRVIALPGDRVEVLRGEVLLNGQAVPVLLDPDPVKPLAARYYTESGRRRHRILFSQPWPQRASIPERVVPRAHLFVLGDNRDRSEDSRHFGVISFDAIVGFPFVLGPSARRGEGLSWTRAGMLL